MFFEVTKVLGATLALFSASALAAPVDTAAVAPQKTLFLLAGDSTTAKQSYPDNGGGAFLPRRLLRYIQLFLSSHVSIYIASLLIFTYM